MITVSADLKRFFFDRKAIIDRIDAAKRRVFSKAGAFIRRRARSSMRRRKRSAAPGQPPSTHATGAASLKNIQFGWDPTIEGVVVGPVKLNSRSGEVPGLMEFGGVARRVVNRRFRAPGGTRAVKTATYVPHPFMGPSLKAEIEAGTIAGAWAGAVKG